MTTEYLSVTDTAKLVRQALKAAHPRTKFSVRSDSYAGGASINVSWTDGPTDDAVQATTKLYEGSTFDSMTDCKNYHNTLLTGPGGTVRDVHFGADFIFTRRELSPAYRAQLADIARACLGDFDPEAHLTDYPCFDTREGYVRGGPPRAILIGLSALYPA